MITDLFFSLLLRLFLGLFLFGGRFLYVLFRLFLGLRLLFLSRFFSFRFVDFLP